MPPVAASPVRWAPRWVCPWSCWDYSCTKRAASIFRQSLLHAEEFDFKHQRGVRRNHAARASFAVAEAGGDRELANSAHLHSRDALVPALDDLACSELKAEWLPA